MPRAFHRVLAWLMFPWHVADRVARRRHALLRERPFPVEWEAILRRNVRLYSLLPEGLRLQLQGHMNVFLAEKRFEGCGGLEMNDDIRVTIAAQACLLLLNRETSYYPRVSAVLVYPSSFFVERHQPFGVTSIVGTQEVLGVAWSRDYVILSWSDVRRGAGDFGGGHNVVVHEFAHQLDVEDGTFDGVPVLSQRTAYAAWARVLGAEYKKLVREVARGQNRVIDAGGAEKPSEFFAFVSESFFEKPRELREQHAELYGVLKDFYRVDPAEWENTAVEGVE